LGVLTELGEDETPPTMFGHGQKLVRWWRDADDEDRATLRRWVEEGVPSRIIADRLTAAGFPIGTSTMRDGVRLLRRTHWEP
jgi:hypothetical protein